MKIGSQIYFLEASGGKRGRKKKIDTIKPIKTEYIESKRIVYTAEGKPVERTFWVPSEGETGRKRKKKTL